MLFGIRQFSLTYSWVVILNEECRVVRADREHRGCCWILAGFLTQQSIHYLARRNSISIKLIKLYGTSNG